MLKKISLIRQIGQFENVAANQVELTPMSLIYAENGRGKTTLVSVLRSLQSGDPLIIGSRKRLGSLTDSEVVLDFSDEPNAVVFQNNSWNKVKNNIYIFDEQFVNDNIYSGLVVQSPQREGLHGLIVGAKGVSLLRSLQVEVSNVEEHNKQLRKLGDAIPPNARKGLTVDQFCDLPMLDEIDQKIGEVKKALSASDQQAAVAKMGSLDELVIAVVAADTLQELLSESLADVAAKSELLVKEHLRKIGGSAEDWIAQGRQLQLVHAEELGDNCPFCAQPVSDNDLVGAYSQHFSETYNALKLKMQRAVNRIGEIYGSAAVENIRGQFSGNISKHLFWSEFVSVKIPEIDIETILASVRKVAESATKSLDTKAEMPLEVIELSAEAKLAIQALDRHRASLASYNEAIQEMNLQIAGIRERSNTSSSLVLRNDLLRLEVSKERLDPAIVRKCSIYLAERAEKKTTEARRARAKTALDKHLLDVFPAFQELINQFLRRLSAGYKIDGVKSLNTRRGPSCIYKVVIDSSPNHPVAVNAETNGEPSFKTVLSTSDRSTLALAVFLASVDHDDLCASKIVVIDDPITSLDEHRAFATVSEIRRLQTRVSQVIVMSHRRSLVCSLWESPGQIGKVAIEFSRAGSTSSIREWSVSAFGFTEHDKRHEKLREYILNQPADSRDTAEGIRPTLEKFLRVAYPEHYVPGTMLGQFLDRCKQCAGAVNEILAQYDIDELGAIKAYANQFHHDSNPAYVTAHINDAELLSFVRRTLAFAKRGP